jgi:polyisoprenoid-binding protein YceI
MKPTHWTLDASHSEIQFKVKHLMISTVTGQFNKFSGTLETDGDDFATAKVHFSADIESVSTNNEQRDAHLKTGDFFDAAAHPQLTFVSDKMEKIDNENYKLDGILTLRGTSKKITLDVEFGGQTQDPRGNTRVGFSVSGKLNRKDFGVSFSMVSESGGVLLGEEVKIFANTEFVKQAEPKVSA